MPSELMTYGEAIGRALARAAETDKRIIIFGEGTVDPSPVFGTLSAFRKIAPDRMIEMPTAENALVGIAAGAAMNGMIPVVSFHRVEFALIAMEQIVNVVAKTRWNSRGEIPMPMLLRLIIGRGWGQGAVHAQSMETMFAAIPGLRVVMPASASDAYWMTLGALAANGPTVMIENRWCHGVSGQVDTEAADGDPFDGARLVYGAGGLSDILTIASTSYMTIEAQLAADILGKIGIQVSVFDVRVLRPLEISPIAASVASTGHLITVDTGPAMYGVGAEIITRLIELGRGRDFARAPRRLGTKPYPVPSSRFMISGYYPDAEMIVRTVMEMLHSVRSADEVIREFLPPAEVDKPRNIVFGGPF